MISFKQFLKQKKLYGVDGTSEFNELYNTDMNVIDPDLGEPSEDDEQTIDDTKDDDKNNETEKVEEIDTVIDEDGEASSGASVSGTDGAMGGTTSADIATVPYGLTNKEDKESIGLIARMDAYL